MQTTYTVDLGDRSYPIHIGTNLLGNPDTYADLPAGSSAMIVSNTTVAPLYLEQLQTALAPHFPAVHNVILPDGEQYKNWETLQLIFDALLEKRCDRKTIVFALGGGVIGDMAGYAAASYMRGVRFVQVPTTLLAQVDSSVGGKTGINHPKGKNMIGAFYQPLKVVCDISTFQTLPAREVSAGLAEVIKYGPIADSDFFQWTRDNIAQLRALDTAALTHAVERSCQIKADVVAQDEREGDIRAILNFGHTFGHAIEAEMGYGTWLHGEAVGCGMVLAAQLSENLGMTDAQFTQDLTTVVEQAGLPIAQPTEMTADDFFKHMAVDKKAEGGAIKYVLIEEVGKAVIQTQENAVVKPVLE